MKYILSIDEGTTGITVMILDRNTHIKSRVDCDFKQHYPKPGWVEHDALEIWALTQKLIKQALAKGKIKGTDIAAIGITNQRETTVLWNGKTGKPVARAIVWQDRRTTDFCKHLKADAATETFVKRHTGLVLDPYFSATKVRWLLDHVPLAKKTWQSGQLKFGTMDSWLVYNLTAKKNHVTDVTNASRTLLFNLATLNWDDSLLQTFGVPRAILPEVKTCAEVYGFTKNVAGLPDGIPISGMAGDQQAALFGQACFDVGQAKCTYGTGSFLLMNIGETPTLSKSGLLTTVAWKFGDQLAYALEGSAFIAGAAVQWLRDELQLIEKSSDVEKLAMSVKDNGGVSFVPALAGLGAPYWEPAARGVLSGLTRGSNRGHVARAVLEGIALSQYDILLAMQNDSGKKLTELRVDGGATENNLLMQFQADVLGCQILRPKIVETTAMGAAFLAGLGVGYWKSPNEIKKVFKIDHKFKPKMQAQQKATVLQQWQKAVTRAKIQG